MILASGRFPGEENGYPFQYSCLENSMDGRAWQATVHRVSKYETQLFIVYFGIFCRQLKSVCILLLSGGVFYKYVQGPFS